MFCFLVLKDHVAQGDDHLTDAGYLHIEGPYLSAQEVMALHVQCLKEGIPFRIFGETADQLCYEGRLCNAQGPADHQILLNWACACTPVGQLAMLDAQDRWVPVGTSAAFDARAAA